jgi:hypothetical protein
MTIEEQRKAIIEDERKDFEAWYIHRNGLILDDDEREICFDIDGDKYVNPYIQLAIEAWQAARNQSNNVPVAGTLTMDEHGWHTFELNGFAMLPEGIYQLYTSPQQSNALEMAAKVWKYQTRIKLSTASEWCAWGEWMLTENWEAVQGVLDYAKKVNDFQVNYVAYAEIPQPESDGK